MSEPLDVALWRKAEKVFSLVVDQPAGLRARAVEQACGLDERLRYAVETLLALEDDGEMGTPLAASGGTATVTAGLGPGPESLGPYRLLQLIGEGGTSRVFLAEKTGADFKQPVALKLLREGELGPVALRRFRSERRILAELDHPNIARLLDGGTSETGEPFVVMEYVLGLPITRHCDERRLSVRRRVELFLAVCDAVREAHAKLVIHRDLKPNNVLVTDDGQLKLLDFGIAKRLVPEPGGEEVDAHTATQERAFTPAYASPEQIAGGPLGTATDIYSLGVMLHELLVGCRPAASLAQPLPPSHRLSREQRPVAGDSASVTVAESRSTGPKQLRRLLAGDLDNVVLRALAREPRERYPSVEQLSEDLQRWLAGRPVQARPRGRFYRAGKFVRRNAWAVACALLALLSLAALAATSFRESLRVRRERDHARVQQRRAEEVTRVLVEAFEQADPHEARGRTVTVREVLDRTAERVSRSLSGEPAVQATLRDALGRAYAGLGMHDEAAVALEAALAGRRRVHGAGSLEAAETLMHLGLLYHQRGDDRAAEPAFREALELRRRHLGEDDLQVAEGLLNLGCLLRDRGEHDEAGRLLRRALDLRRAKLGDGHREVAVAWSQLGFLEQRRGELQAAEAAYRQALAGLRREAPPDDPATATVLASLAWLLDTRGEPAEAEGLYAEALAIRRTVFGRRHAAVATTLNSMATLQRNQASYARAEALAREAVDISRAALPADHPDTAAALTTLAIVLRDRGRPAEALPLLSEALASSRRALGPDDPDVAAHLSNLGTVLGDLGRYAPAEQALAEALALRRRRLGPGHWQVGATLAHLADLRRATGRAADGRALAAEAVSILAAGLPPKHWRTADARTILGDCLVALGRIEEAAGLVREGEAALRAVQGSAGYNARRARARLARLEAACAVRGSSSPGCAASLKPPSRGSARTPAPAE